MNNEAARQEVLAFMHTLEEEPHHVQHVARLALQLFDNIPELQPLGDPDRLLLEAAALLHDVGWTTAPSGRGHHRESARLIRAHAWTQFSPAAVNLMAQIARYHRKSLPNLEHDDFAALSPAERLRLQQLAALLRIADGLDRSHHQYVTGLRVELPPGHLVIHLAGTHPVSREIAAAARKADLARAVFQRQISLISPQPVEPPVPPEQH